VAELFNFDNSVGQITEPANFSGFSEAPLYGVEFSASSRFLYIGQFDKLIYQFDLASDNIYNSKVVLGDDFILHDDPSQLQLAPDGKIYIAKYDMTFIGAIHFPDKAGKACGYEPEAIQIPLDTIRFCLSGLPNFISTYLYNPELYPPDPIFEMPNVFTPNGDDYNPSFVPIKMYNVKDTEMKIFNRWGQEIYSTGDLEKGWDGGNFSADVYYWRVDYTGVNDKNYSQRRLLSLAGLSTSSRLM
jgi:gliding motility-associated-like protein